MSSRINVGFNDPKGAIIRKPGVGILFAAGITVPANATTDYAPGCIFLDQDATDPGLMWWRNEGTAASCTFRAIGSQRGIVTAITTLAVTRTLHEGKTVLLSLLAGFTSTLPLATGSGDRYRFAIGIVNTSASYIINTAGSDVFKGSLPLSTPASTWATANIGETFASTTGVHLTMNGTATGGATIGDFVDLEDIQSGVWKVSGWLTTTTTPTTPFS